MNNNVMKLFDSVMQKTQFDFANNARILPMFLHFT